MKLQLLNSRDWAVDRMMMIVLGNFYPISYKSGLKSSARVIYLQAKRPIEMSHTAGSNSRSKVERDLTEEAECVCFEAGDERQRVHQRGRNLSSYLLLSRFFGLTLIRLLGSLANEVLKQTYPIYGFKQNIPAMIIAIQTIGRRHLLKSLPREQLSKRQFSLTRYRSAL